MAALRLLLHRMQQESGRWQSCSAKLRYFNAAFDRLYNAMLFGPDSSCKMTKVITRPEQTQGACGCQMMPMLIAHTALLWDSVWMNIHCSDHKADAALCCAVRPRKLQSCTGRVS